MNSAKEETLTCAVRHALLDTALKSAIILVASVIIATILLVISFCLPNDPIFENVKASIDTFYSEGSNYPSVIDNTKVTTLDNFTDELMLNAAAYLPGSSLSQGEGYSAIQRALLVPHAKDGTSQFSSLLAYCNGEEVAAENYSRYWHGYMIFLRPMLLFFDYSLIRFFLFVVHLSLCAWFLILLNKKCGSYATIAFVATYMICGSFIIPFSIFYSSVTNVTLITGIMLLQFYEKLVKRGWVKYLFLITGILTVFFDLSTFPVVSLGVNLCLHILLSKDIKFREILILCVMWAIGFLAMWACKWVVASVLTQENAIELAISQAAQRTSSSVAGENDNGLEFVTFLDVLQVNFERICNPCTIIAFEAILIIAFIVKVLKGNNTLNKSKVICTIFVIAIPIIWYFLVKNHSYVHNWFTFRTLFPLLLGVLLLPECLSKQKLHVD